MQAAYKCASTWFTPMRGLFSPLANPFAKFTPIDRAPIRPGVLATEINSISSKETPALCVAAVSSSGNVCR
ncbi:Uncharacterised protein [Chlamydia trachomatis]|nr:Uncharacterised protein [Chlamydia trachomatis]